MSVHGVCTGALSGDELRHQQQGSTKMLDLLSPAVLDHRHDVHKIPGYGGYSDAYELVGK